MGLTQASQQLIPWRLLLRESWKMEARPHWLLRVSL